MDKWDLMLQTELEQNAVDLKKFVIKCCYNLKTNAQQVIDELLSIEDERDIINGDISIECLRAHIAIWIEQGKQNYANKRRRGNC